MASDWLKVMSWLYRQQPTKNTERFDDYLELAVGAVLGKSGSSKHTIVDNRKSMYWNSWCAQRQRDIERGLSSPFEIVDHTSRRFRWAPYTLKVYGNRPITDRIRQRMLAKSEILTHISLYSSCQYEALGAVASQLMGASNVLVTEPGDERGIDFLAKIDLPSRNHIFSGPAAPIRVIGQSKMHGSALSVGDVMAFIQTLTAVRNSDPDVMRNVPTWFAPSRGILAGWIVCHSGFQSGAEAAAYRHGVLISNSVDIAEITAMSRSLDEGADPRSRALRLTEHVDLLL